MQSKNNMHFQSLENAYFFDKNGPLHDWPFLSKSVIRTANHVKGRSYYRNKKLNQTCKNCFTVAKAFHRYFCFSFKNTSELYQNQSMFPFKSFQLRDKVNK